VHIKPRQQDLRYFLVFARPDGKPLVPDSGIQGFTRLVRRTGFYGLRLHDLRHSNASLMLHQGIHPKIVQERLGHASIQLTLDTYSHVTFGLQRAATQKFEEGLHLPGVPSLNDLDKIWVEN
jgi:integrase